jgi:threonine aldolase
VCGPKELIAEARRLRKRLGGGMRQSGVLAAAGLHALDHHRERLLEDHANARRLAEGLAALGAELPFPVETNLVFAALPGRLAADVSRRLAAEGVLVSPEGSRPDLLRLVTHLDVSAGDVDEALARARRALAS